MRTSEANVPERVPQHYSKAAGETSATGCDSSWRRIVSVRILLVEEDSVETKVLQGVST